MKIRMTTKETSTGYVFDEEYNINNKTNPEEYAQGLINNFNATLRPHESPRELVSVSIVRDNTEEVHDHIWEKQNLVTVLKGGKLYDVMKCKICGVTGKRYGLQSYIERDAKYKASKYDSCDWYLEK